MTATNKKIPKQIDLRGKFKGLDGKPILDQNGGELIDINKYVGNMIVMMTTEESARNVSLGTKIFESKLVTLEDHDVSFILNIIKEAKNAKPPKIYFPDIMFNQFKEKMTKNLK